GEAIERHRHYAVLPRPDGEGQCQAVGDEAVDDVFTPERVGGRGEGRPPVVILFPPEAQNKALDHRQHDDRRGEIDSVGEDGWHARLPATEAARMAESGAPLSPRPKSPSPKAASASPISKTASLVNPLAGLAEAVPPVIGRRQ